ncbi:MAG: zinc-dependent alcohol dehydrogenase family protein [Candidatus Hydrogenedens sp.]
MKAMVLREQNSIETSPLTIEEWDIPEPNEKELLIKVICCAICRTDLHIIEGELHAKRLPIIPGHQIIGVVEKTGNKCTKFRIGDKVGIAWLRKTCGICSFCKTEKENLCEHSLYTGYHEHGGYAEYTLIHEDYAYPLPNNLDDIKTAPLLCAGIIGYRAWKKSEIKKGQIVALYGFGASAHIILQIAKAKGASVFVVSRKENHQKLAKELGADWTDNNPSKMPDLPDASIIFAPNGNLIPTSLQYLKKGGKLVLAGIYMSDTPSLEYEKHLFYEKQIISVSANTRNDGQELFEEVKNIPIKTHVEKTSLVYSNQILQKLKNGILNGSGVVVID